VFGRSLALHGVDLLVGCKGLDAEENSVCLLHLRHQLHCVAILAIHSESLSMLCQGGLLDAEMKTK